MRELTHASFFSGVGGLDVGLERAGFRTISFSEIDPYACAVLAHHWPDVPNLGDIVQLDRWDAEHGLRADSPQPEGGVGAGDPVGTGGADSAGGVRLERSGQPPRRRARPSGQGEPQRSEHGVGGERDGDDWRSATLFSAAFPCQDLSVAGKRKGFTGERSSLAFAFIDLLERYRPPAAIFENVPGLLSSHGGRDMARLLSEMVDLGYGVAYRTLNAQFFGVPQRRSRVFIVALRSDPDDPDGHLAAQRAAEILAVGTRCDRHPPTGVKEGKGTPAGAPDGAGEPRVYSSTAAFGHWEEDDKVGTLSQRDYKSPNQLVSSPTPDSGGDRAPDGVRRRLDDRAGVASAFVKRARAQSSEDDESWGEGDVAPTLNQFDVGDARAVTLLTQSLPTTRVGTDDNDAQGGMMVIGGRMDEDPLLPAGLDSHRYRACGNAIVVNVAEWIGHRLAAALTED